MRGMCTSHKTAATLIVLLLKAPIAARPLPQQSEPITNINQITEKVSRLIESSDDRDRAWAAYYIRERRLTEYVPNLLEFLKKASTGAAAYESLLVKGTLDALIQLDVDIPANDLFGLFQGDRAAVIYYLSRSASQNERLILMLMDQPYVTTNDWFALANSLVESKSSSLAAVLLRDIKIEASVSVTDDSGAGGGVGRGMGFAIGCGGAYRKPEGYPPTAYYSVTVTDRDRPSGFHKVQYLRRIVLPEEDEPGPAGQIYDSSQRDALRFECLARLLDRSTSDPGIDLKPSFYVTWKGPQQFKKAVQEFKAGIALAYRQYAAQFVERKLLTTAEVNALTPPVSLRIHDYRGDKQFALPKIDGSQ